MPALAIEGTGLMLTKGEVLRATPGRVWVQHGRVAEETEDGIIMGFWGAEETFILALPQVQIRALDPNTRVSMGRTDGNMDLQWKRLAERVVSLTTGDITSQLKDLLRDLGRRMGKAEGKKIILPPFTHQDIARYLGSPRELVTIYMGTLKRAGLVDYDREGITLSAKLMGEGQ